MAVAGYSSKRNEGRTWARHLIEKHSTAAIEKMLPRMKAVAEEACIKLRDDLEAHMKNTDSRMGVSALRRWSGLDHSKCCGDASMGVRSRGPPVGFSTATLLDGLETSLQLNNFQIMDGSILFHVSRRSAMDRNQLPNFSDRVVLQGIVAHSPTMKRPTSRATLSEYLAARTKLSFEWSFESHLIGRECPSVSRVQLAGLQVWQSTYNVGKVNLRPTQ